MGSKWNVLKNSFLDYTPSFSYMPICKLYIENILDRTYAKLVEHVHQDKHTPFYC